MCGGASGRRACPRTPRGLRATPGAPPLPAGGAEGSASAAVAGGSGSSDEDDGLPPLERINNRKVIEYEVSDTDSD